MSSPGSGLRYQADENPPAAASLGLGLQLAALSLSATILITTVVMRGAGQSDAYLSWAVFAAIAIGGGASMLQAFRLGRLGTGQVLMMGSSGAFIAVCIAALVAGGPGLLATLVITSALFQFAISDRLALFRRILTPTVSGTVLMLIPVSVISPVLDLLADVPEAGPSQGAMLSALATVLVICGLTLKASGAVRLWASVIGILAGSLVAALFGLYDTTRVATADWIGLPALEWPGIELTFGPAFWALLPGFLLAAMISSIRTISSAAAAQRVAWRASRAPDFRAVQGAVAVDGLSNLLSGLAGTGPNTAYSTGASLAQLTGVASRTVGIVAGAAFLALAFLPKGIAVVLAIPGPVFAAFLVVMMAVLFMVGIQMIVQDGIDYRKSTIVGVSFWLGVSFQSGAVFPEVVSSFAGGLFNNGMTVGGFAAILMTLFLKATESRPSRMESALDLSGLPEFRNFLGGFASASGWNRAMAHRLGAACEEVVLTLLGQDDAGERSGRRLLLLARKDGGGAILEFTAAAGETGNLQDRVALLGEQDGEDRLEQEVSLRLLRHLAASVRHQQYHDVDIVTVRVNPP